MGERMHIATQWHRMEGGAGQAAGAAVKLLDLSVPPLPRMLCLGGCGKYLWDPKSRKRRYGDECAKRLGIVDPSLPRFSRRDGGDCAGQTDLTKLLEAPDDA